MIAGNEAEARHDWGRAALIGGTGFVGGILSRAASFDATYASATIETIAGESFDTVICAGAPAAMWKANADPEGDRRNLDRLTDALSKAHIRRLVLISTIAVLANPAGAITEDTEAFEAASAYGRNRRALEVSLGKRFHTLVMRLPALFGPGLKKNFLFDLAHPAPSFLKPAAFDDLQARVSATIAARLTDLYRDEASLALKALDRTALMNRPDRAELEAAIIDAGFEAARFTHEDSTFQFYGLHRLNRDIDRGLALDLSTLHLATEPWRAGDLHVALTGRLFNSTQAVQRHEDMRTRHGAKLGGGKDYLQDRQSVLNDIRTEWDARAW